MLHALSDTHDYYWSCSTNLSDELRITAQIGKTNRQRKTVVLNTSKPLLCARRIYPLKSDAEVECQVWLHIVMRLIAPRRR